MNCFFFERSVRTNIDIDDELLAKALFADPCKTKQDAVEAGLQWLARPAACREELKWDGRLRWEDLCLQAAQHDRDLHRHGVAVRKGIDVRVAPFCIDGDDLLLHRDRDFQVIEALRGLRTWNH